MYLLWRCNGNGNNYYNNVGFCTNCDADDDFCDDDVLNHMIILMIVTKILVINPSLAKHDMPCLSKQYRSRSVGF